MLNAAKRLIQSFYSFNVSPGTARAPAGDHPPHRPMGTPPRLRWNRKRGERRAEAEAFAREAERNRQSVESLRIEKKNPDAWKHFGSLRGPQS